MNLLSRVDSPKALRALAPSELPALCEALRDEIIRICGKVGGHLGASLGTVLSRVGQVAAKVLPDGVSGQFQGEASAFESSLSNLAGKLFGN